MAISIESKINNWDLKNKKVFLRADLNVPLENGKILDDFKLKSILPTLDLLVKKEANIILTTHIANPESYDKNLSTINLLDWFKKIGYKINFCANFEDLKNRTNNNNIILFENLRFWPEEKDLNKNFAQKLKDSCDYYINDAFGTLHRDNTSITLLPTLFDSNHKSIGLLIEKELFNLNKLIDKPQKPFLLIMGGAKIKDKLPLIKNFILNKKVDKILLCPAIVFTFLKALGKNVGKSLIVDEVINTAKEILELSYNNSTEIVFPIDYLIAHDNINGKLEYINGDNIGTNNVGISIGPKTLEIYKTEILKAKTIFLNGTMGFDNLPKTEIELKEILQSISQSTAYSVIGGGESIAAVSKFGELKAFSFISTGGGATLAYLANGSLPNLILLN